MKLAASIIAILKLSLHLRNFAAVSAFTPFSLSYSSSSRLILSSQTKISTTTKRMASSTTTANDDIVTDATRELYLRTPLVKSIPLTNLLGGINRDVYIKLDCLQSSGSFKDRGMAHFCNTLKTKKNVNKLIGSSGGNAGLALATLGAKLNMDVSVIVPKSTKALVIEKLKSLGASVTVHGDIWNEADELARSLANDDDAAEYCSPYDHPLLWTGHSTMIDEIKEDLPTSNDDFTVVVGVGGGGLLCGVLEGIQRNGLHNVNVVTAETDGTNCFELSMKQNELVRLDTISSIATSLGALEVTQVALDRSNDHNNNNEGSGSVYATKCTDAEAVNACIEFAKDHRILVEPACGAGLAMLYSERLRNEIFMKNNDSNSPIIVEVCGGSGVNLDLLEQWKNEFLS